MGPTRRIVMFNWVTADGYFAAPDGSLEWVVPDEEQARAAAEGIPGFDTVLFGRRTYELFEGFWRHAVDDSPHSAGPPPSWTAIPGTPSRSDLAKRDDQIGLLQNPEGRDVEEFPHPP
jgi:dihydrofolate reductase